jgi:hypothetical protein
MTVICHFRPAPEVQVHCERSEKSKREERERERERESKNRYLRIEYDYYVATSHPEAASKEDPYCNTTLSSAISDGSTRKNG